MDQKQLKQTATNIRTGLIKAIHAAGSGHPGGSLSAADIVTALYFEEMNINPKDPDMKEKSIHCWKFDLCTAGYWRFQDLFQLFLKMP